MRRISPFWSLTLALALLPSTGCLFRTRPVEETYSKTPLRETSQSALIDSINQQAEKVRSLQATVDIDTSVGGARKGCGCAPHRGWVGSDQLELPGPADRLTAVGGR